jgi:hypothetical protein
MVEMHKPPNFKVIDEICVGPLAFHRRCRLQRQDSANCNPTSVIKSSGARTCSRPILCST